MIPGELDMTVGFFAGVSPSEWEWFGAPGHFICSEDCRFHLCTKVGCYLVSTVGEMWPDRTVRKIHASVYDAKWLAANVHLKGDYFDAAYMKRFGFETVGYDRLYETMVFTAGKPCQSRQCGCGLPEISGSELDFEGYQTAAAATKGHRVMCERWAARPPKSESEPAPIDREGFGWRLAFHRIAEGADGKKIIEYSANAYDNAGKRCSGMLGCDVRLGQEITIRKHADGHWVLSGHAIGLAPLAWDFDDPEPDDALTPNSEAPK